MFHFALIPMPAAPPIASHQRGSPLVSSLVTRHSATVQQTKSGTVVVSSCMRAQVLGRSSRSRSPASSWPRSTAPSVRAIDRGKQHERGERERGQRAQPDERVPGDQRVEVREQRGE